MLAEIAGRQLEHFGKHFAADLLHQVAGEVAGAVFVDEVEDTAQDKQADNCQRHPPHSGEVFLYKAFVNQWFKQPGENRPGGGHHHHAEHGQGENAQIVFQVAKQSAI